MHPRPALLALTCLAVAAGLTSACSATSRAAAPPPLSSAPAAPAGPDSGAALQRWLLQPGDLPGLTLRTYASPDLLRTADPRLSLCRPAGAAAPHEVANVYGEPGHAGQAVVFEVVNAFPSPAGARAAYDAARAAAGACPRYTTSDATVQLTDLAPVPLRAPAAGFHYRLRTADVVTGDARTLAVRGRFTVLVSGYGRPRDGQDLLAYQAGLVERALRRLPAS